MGRITRDICQLSLLLIDGDFLGVEIAVSLVVIRVACVLGYKWHVRCFTFFISAYYSPRCHLYPKSFISIVYIYT